MSRDQDVDYSILTLFHWLAQRDPTKAGVDIRIPITITYAHGSLQAWYYYDVDTHQIARLDKKQCSKEAILKAFTKDVGSCPCAAMFLFRKCEFMEEDIGTEATSVEFLSSEGVTAFLSKRQRRPDSMLQKFLAPPRMTENNSLIQVIWTPSVTLIYHRKNMNPLYDERYPLHDRCITHEDKLHLSVEVYSPPTLHRRCTELCQKMAAHLLNHEKRILSRMVVFFKFDINGELNLTWASTVVSYRYTISAQSPRLNPNDESDRVSMATSARRVSTATSAAEESSQPSAVPKQKRQLLNLSPTFTFPSSLVKAKREQNTRPNAIEYCIVEPPQLDLMHISKSMDQSQHSELAAAAELALEAVNLIPPIPYELSVNANRWRHLKNLPKTLSPVKATKHIKTPPTTQSSALTVVDQSRPNTSPSISISTWSQKTALLKNPVLRYCHGGGRGMFIPPNAVNSRPNTSSSAKLVPVLHKASDSDSEVSNEASPSSDYKRPSLPSAQPSSVDFDEAAFSFNSWADVQADVRSARSSTPRRKRSLFTIVRDQESHIFELINNSELQSRHQFGSDRHRIVQSWLEDIIYELYSRSLSPPTTFNIIVPLDVASWVGISLKIIFLHFNLRPSVRDEWEFLVDPSQVNCTPFRKFLVDYRDYLSYHFMMENLSIFKDITQESQNLLNSFDASASKYGKMRSTRKHAKKIRQLAERRVMDYQQEIENIRSSTINRSFPLDSLPPALEHLPPPPGPLSWPIGLFEEASN